MVGIQDHSILVEALNKLPVSDELHQKLGNQGCVVAMRNNNGELRQEKFARSSWGPCRLASALVPH